jgi:hypothetical protein
MMYFVEPFALWVTLTVAPQQAPPPPPPPAPVVAEVAVLGPATTVVAYPGDTVVECVDLQGYPFVTDIGSFDAWADHCVVRA